MSIPIFGAVFSLGTRMRSTLSNQGIALRRDKLLTWPEARIIVAEFMVRTGLLGQFQAVDPTALGVGEGGEGAEIMIP
jgi:hypothetical protein